MYFDGGYSNYLQPDCKMDRGISYAFFQWLMHIDFVRPMTCKICELNLENYAIQWLCVSF
jgi:hypothetical protein